MDTAGILIVEDNTTLAEDAGEYLKSLGYFVTDMVATGNDAINSVRKKQPDAVLMDIKLRGDMDGIEAAARIHAEFDVPVLFLSAYSDRALLERAKRSGSVGYLVKPFEERELHAMLEMILYRARAEKERRQMEIRLRRLEKTEAMNKMAGGIAHHFNNSLTVVIGNLELAMHDLPSDTPIYHMVSEARMAAKESARMSRLMLTFVGNEMVERKPLDLAKTCQSCLQTNGKTIAGEIDLEMNICEDEPVIMANRTQIEELINALLSNAFHAIKPNTQGRITVSVSRRETPQSADLFCFPADCDCSGQACACLEVADNGMGMPDEMIENIFDPFFSVDGPARRGLGLSLVAGITKTHEGCVKVKSTPGKGSVFSLFFPLLADQDS